MFTLKFYRTNDTHGSVARVVACPKYETSVRPGFVQVFVFKQIDDDMYADVVILASPNPTCSVETTQMLANEASGGRHVYETLYVENMSGKTIDHVHTH